MSNLMQGTQSYKKANLLLNNFIDKKLKLYDKLRNYDYGLDNPHKQVSGLSPYISIGLINEPYILRFMENLLERMARKTK